MFPEVNAQNLRFSLPAGTAVNAALTLGVRLVGPGNNSLQFYNFRSSDNVGDPVSLGGTALSTPTFSGDDKRLVTVVQDVDGAHHLQLVDTQSVRVVRSIPVGSATRFTLEGSRRVLLAGRSLAASIIHPGSRQGTDVPIDPIYIKLPDGKLYELVSGRPVVDRDVVESYQTLPQSARGQTTTTTVSDYTAETGTFGTEEIRDSGGTHHYDETTIYQTAFLTVRDKDGKIIAEEIFLQKYPAFPAGFDSHGYPVNTSYKIETKLNATARTIEVKYARIEGPVGEPIVVTYKLSELLPDLFAEVPATPSVPSVPAVPAKMEIAPATPKFQIPGGSFEGAEDTPALKQLMADRFAAKRYAVLNDPRGDTPRGDMNTPANTGRAESFAEEVIDTVVDAQFRAQLKKELRVVMLEDLPISQHGRGGKAFTTPNPSAYVDAGVLTALADMVDQKKAQAYFAVWLEHEFQERILGVKHEDLVDAPNYAQALDFIKLVRCSEDQRMKYFAIRDVITYGPVTLQDVETLVKFDDSGTPIESSLNEQQLFNLKMKLLNKQQGQHLALVTTNPNINMDDFKQWLQTKIGDQALGKLDGFDALKAIRDPNKILKNAMETFGVFNKEDIRVLTVQDNMGIWQGQDVFVFTQESKLALTEPQVAALKEAGLDFAIVVGKDGKSYLYLDRQVPGVSRMDEKAVSEYMVKYAA